MWKAVILGWAHDRLGFRALVYLQSYKVNVPGLGSQRLSNVSYKYAHKRGQSKVHLLWKATQVEKISHLFLKLLLTLKQIGRFF